MPIPTRRWNWSRGLGENSPNCAVLVTSSSHDGHLILRAMRAGAKEFLTQPMRIDDLLGALGRITERRSGPGETRPRGCQVIAVAGVLGGVGTTSVAVNLACILAKTRRTPSPWSIWIISSLFAFIFSLLLVTL